MEIIYSDLETAKLIFQNLFLDFAIASEDWEDIP